MIKRTKEEIADFVERSNVLATITVRIHEIENIERSLKDEKIQAERFKEYLREKLGMDEE